MRKITLMAALALLTTAVFSQSHNIKLNTTSLIGLRIAEAQYEYTLTDKITLQLGAGLMIPRGNRLISNLNIGDNVNGDAGETSLLSGLRMTGYRLTPEVRFYLGENFSSPEGFYVAPFLRHYRYSLRSSFSEVVNGNLETIDHRTTFGSTGGGIGIGTQWLIDDRFSIDVMWLGIGLTRGKIKTKLTSSFSSDDWDEVESEWREIAQKSDIGFINESEVTSDDNGVQISARNPMPVILRASISVGYYF